MVKLESGDWAKWDDVVFGDELAGTVCSDDPNPCYLDVVVNFVAGTLDFSYFSARR